MRRYQVGEVVRQLLLGEMVDPTLKTFADPANRARVCFDRLRLQPLSLRCCRCNA
jgi:hypothetical protein